MKGEERLILFSTFAGQHETIGRHRRAKVFGVDRAVGIEHLGEAQLDFGSGCACDAEMRDTRHVLAKVEDIDAGLRLRQRLGLQHFLNADGLKILRHNGRFRRFDYLDRLPFRPLRRLAVLQPGCSVRAS